jgi:hypothetical protein
MILSFLGIIIDFIIVRMNVSENKARKEKKEHEINFHPFFYWPDY